MIDLTKPTKQHILGLLFILYNTYSNAIKASLGIVAYAVIKVDDKKYVWLGLLIILILTTIIATLKYFRHRFRLENGQMIVQKGSLFSKELIIPFDKVQNIDFEQNVIHQIFDVGKLKVDTAGSNKDEVEIHALSLETIEQVKTIIFDFKQNAGLNDTETMEDGQQTPQVNEEKKKIFGLSIRDLIIAGLTANHLDSGLLTLALLFSLTQKLISFNIGKDIISENEGMAESLMHDFYAAITLFAIFLIISVFVSMARIVILNFQLEFVRINDGFRLTKGLFNRKVSFAKDLRIQSLTVSQIWLRKLVGMINLKIRMTGDEHNEVNAISVAGMRKQHIDDTIKTLFPTLKVNDDKKLFCSNHYFKFWASWIGGIILALGLIVSWIFGWSWIVAFFIIGLVIIGIIYLKQRKISYHIDDEYLYTTGGIFGNKYKIVKLSKVQSVALNSMPYQRRNNLASLKLTDGGGSTTLTFLPKNLAEVLAEYVIYQINRE
jgi:putative membrane protein